MRDTKRNISQPGCAIYSSATKAENKLEDRAFSARCTTDTTCHHAARIASIPLSLSLSNGGRLYGARGRQWGLCYNAWQIDCLNRIGFHGLHRRASRESKRWNGQRAKTCGRHETMRARKTVCINREKNRPFFHFDRRVCASYSYTHRHCFV